jgi:hypothetical protein
MWIGLYLIAFGLIIIGGLIMIVFQDYKSIKLIPRIGSYIFIAGMCIIIIIYDVKITIQ